MHALIIFVLFFSFPLFAEEVRSVDYFTAGMEQVNVCLEEIEPKYAGTKLAVEHYQYTYDQLLVCIGLLQTYDNELYDYLVCSCERAKVTAAAQPESEPKGLLHLLDAYQQSVAVEHEAGCAELRLIYSQFASLHADMHSLLQYCLRWLRVLKPEEYPLPPSK